MSAPKNTRENSAQAALRGMSIDDLVTFAITDGAVDEQGERIPIKHVADRMGLERCIVYDIASQRRPARARELPLITRATNVVLPIDAIERQIGRVGIRLPVVGESGDASIVKAAATCREFGELMERYGQYGSDRTWTLAEVEDIEKQLNDVYAVGQELIADLRAQVVDPKEKTR